MAFWLRNAQTSALSHPLPVLRAREIETFAQVPNRPCLLGLYCEFPVHASEQSKRISSVPSAFWLGCLRMFGT